MTGIKEPYNIIITGVGGQGNILASGLASMAATSAGYKVVVGETYGASQRGGSVMSHIRLSTNRDYGPLVPYGQADLIVAFEPLEALRVASNYAHLETVVILNINPIYPVSVIFREADYPDVDKIIAAIQTLAGKIYIIDATALAREVGDPRVQNIVMVNALSLCTDQPIKRCYFEAALDDFLDGAGSEQKELNRRAFETFFELKEFA